MKDLINKYRFTVKPVSLENSNSLELARSIQVHPLTYQELPYNPEYSNYAGRLTLEKLSNVSPEEMYWKGMQEIFFQETYQKYQKEDVPINLLVIMMVE